VHLVAACSGGIISAGVLGHLAADDRLADVASLTLMVCALDNARAGTAAAFTSREVAALAVAESARKGYLDGKALAGVFAWLRPNDLIWSYVVNNYLLGKDPPAFDVLYWNQDTVRLAAGLHRDFIMLALDNSLTRAGAATVLGDEVDLASVDVDSYVVAGQHDHIVPWENACRSTQLFGDVRRERDRATRAPRLRRRELAAHEGLAHAQATRCPIHIAPAQRQQLALAQAGQRSGQVKQAVRRRDRAARLGRDRDQSLEIVRREKADPPLAIRHPWFVNQLAGVGGDEAAALCEREDRMQDAEVVEDRLRREPVARLECDERLDLLARDPVERPVAKERDQMHAQAGVVARERRALATELGEVRDEPAAGFFDRKPLRRQWPCRLDQLAQLALGLGAGEPVRAPGPALRAERALHEPALDAELLAGLYEG
jgi:hypothetical protein